jgi:hypothetical protein
MRTWKRSMFLNLARLREETAAVVDAAVAEGAVVVAEDAAAVAAVAVAAVGAAAVAVGGVAVVAVGGAGKS